MTISALPTNKIVVKEKYSGVNFFSSGFGRVDKSGLNTGNRNRYPIFKTRHLNIKPDRNNPLVFTIPKEGHIDPENEKINEVLTQDGRLLRENDAFFLNDNKLSFFANPKGGICITLVTEEKIKGYCESEDAYIKMELCCWGASAKKAEEHLYKSVQIFLAVFIDCDVIILSNYTNDEQVTDAFRLRLLEPTIELSAIEQSSFSLAVAGVDYVNMTAFFLMSGTMESYVSTSKSMSEEGIIKDVSIKDGLKVM